MSNDLLENKLRRILREKNEKIIPGNIKAGITIFGVEGTYENEPKYTELEYIESTGLEYINTGLFPTNHLIEIKFQYTKATDNSSIFGSYNPGFHLTWYKSKWYFGKGNVEGNVNGTSCLNICKVEYNKENQLIINEQVLNNEINAYADNDKLSLFSRTRDGWNKATAKLFYCKIYNKSNGTLVRDLIPAKDITNTVCLYDKVNKTFLYNAGTGEFIAGGVI